MGQGSDEAEGGAGKMYSSPAHCTSSGILAVVPSPCLTGGERVFFPLAQGCLITLTLIHCGPALVTALGGAYSGLTVLRREQNFFMWVTDKSELAVHNAASIITQSSWVGDCAQRGPG